MKLTAQDYKDNCPFCHNVMHFDLTNSGMSKGCYCNKYRIMIQNADDGKRYVNVTSKNHTDCAIIKQKKLNQKLNKCHQKNFI